MPEPQPAQLFLFDRPATSNPVRSEEVRNNFNALGQLNLTNDSAFPELKRDGMPRFLTEDPNNVKFQIFFNNAFRTLVQKIQLGIPAPAKAESLFNPAPVGNTWTIDHNLGSRPLVQVFDLAANELQSVNPAGTVQTVQIAHISSAVLAALPVGPTTAVRVGIPLPYNGAIVDLVVIVDEPTVGGPFDVSLALAGVPLGAGLATIPPASPVGTSITATPIVAPNTFVGPSGLDVLVTPAAPFTSGSVDVYASIQRTLNPGQYSLVHSTINRVVITHPAPTAGFAIILG